MKSYSDYAPVSIATDVSYLGWSSIRLKRGGLSLYLVPEIGGRIVGISLDDHNLCFVKSEMQGKIPRTTERFELDKWRNLLGSSFWGGGRTWVAPESLYPDGYPYPDLDSGPYRYEAISYNNERAEVLLTSSICRDTRLRIRRNVSVDFLDSSWCVEHSIENCGNRKWRGGVWDILTLKRPATVFLPVTREFISLKSKNKRTKDIPSLSEISADCMSIDCEDATEFKAGMRLQDGWIAARISDDFCYMRRFELPRDGLYAHEYPAEIYNSGIYPYFELASHGVQVTLYPGEVTRYKVCEQAGYWSDFSERIGAGKTRYDFGQA